MEGCITTKRKVRSENKIKNSDVAEGDHIIIYGAALLFSIGLFVVVVGLFFDLVNAIKIGGGMVVIGVGIRAAR